MYIHIYIYTYIHMYTLIYTYRESVCYVVVMCTACCSSTRARRPHRK